MASFKQRESRQNVHLNARMLQNAGWSAVTVCNVSSRGLMVKCPAPPARGTFVEIRRGSFCVVGQVKWSHGLRFGLRSQDKIDATSLIEQRQEKRGNVERRSMASRATTAQSAMALARKDTSRQLGRLLEWSAIVAATIGGAALLVTEMHSALAEPLTQAQDALIARR
ncbi:MAG TPA: PilZ domain-containing protein [Novosphingobium sp.]